MKTSAMKKVAVGEVKKHEQRMHGAKTNEEMKRLGRGLAKVANQKSPVRKVRATGL